MTQLLRRRDLDSILDEMDHSVDLATREKIMLGPEEVNNLLLEQVNSHRARWARLVFELDDQNRLHPDDRDQLIIEARMWHPDLY